MARLLSRDPETGIEEWFEYDHDAGEFTITKRQNIEPILQQNAVLRRDSSAGDSWKYNGSFDAPVKVAETPIVVALALVERGILNRNFSVRDRKAYRKWLNDPENEVFRTRLGKV